MYTLLLRIAFISLLLVNNVCGVLNVHLVCHTHNDAGWIKTVDQYYTGTLLTDSHREYVDIILDTVINELSKAADRKFVYSEQVFFQLWWSVQSNTTKSL